MSILNKILQHETGVTVKKNGKVYNPKTGYFVAVTNNIFDKITAKEIRQIGIKRSKTQKKYRQGAYYGYWKDQDKNYLDVSLHVKSRDKAVSLAKNHDQLAVWDCLRQESLFV